MIVAIRRGPLNYFRRKARATPNEIMAILIGKNVGGQRVEIYQLAYPELKVSTPMEVEAEEWSVDDIFAAAEADGLWVVGSIHTHPGGPQYMSRFDLKSHIECEDKVSGICEVRNRRTHVAFWIDSKPIPCKIEYLP